MKPIAAPAVRRRAEAAGPVPGDSERSRYRAARTRALELLAAPAPLLVVTDFDGTLSPIDPDPMGARIEPLGRSALRRLARISRRRPGRLRVFVLSGRSVVDVASRVRVGGLGYLGNHGIESGALRPRGRPESIRATVVPGLERFVESASIVGSRVVEQVGAPPWLFLEAKGPSVAFHFRQAPDTERARRAIDQAIEEIVAQLPPGEFERLDGRKVVELRPGGAGAKGAAVARLIDRERPGAVLVLGDDRSDAEAFRVVVEGRRIGRFDALAIGVHGAVETPAEVVAAADVILGSPRDAARLLGSLGRALERPG